MKTMKRMIAVLLAVLAAVGMTACNGGGSSGGGEAPDLQAFYDSYMAGLGEDAPAMSNTNDDPSYVDSFYPGLSDYELKQSVLYMATISATAYELALVECANEGDVEAVKGIMQARIDNQVNGGAFYPETTEAWQKADLIVSENVVALIVAGEDQAKAVGAFKDVL